MNWKVNSKPTPELPRPHSESLSTTTAWWPMGLLLPATLAQHLPGGELVDHHLDLGVAPGRANTGDKILTLVASALVGGDCIDDGCAARRWDGPHPGRHDQGAIHPGHLPAQFSLGPRPLDRVSRELGTRLAGQRRPRRLAPDHRPGLNHLRDLRTGQGRGGKRGYHPLLAVAAGTGDVLMCRLREGRANTARGAAHFLRETVGRVRYGGAIGQLTVRADSGFYTHSVVSVCSKLDVRFSITIRQHKSLRNLIEAIPEADWTPIPYWMAAPPMWPRPPAPPSRVSPTPHRCGSLSGG